MRTFWPSIIAMLSFFVITGSVMGFFIDTQPNFKSIVIDRSATEYDTGSSAIEIGDVDPNVPGNEILVTGYGWGIAEVYFLNDHWESKLIWNRSYQVWYDPALAVGDLDPDVEGNEIVEGLYELIVWTYDNTTGNWTNTTIWNTYGVDDDEVTGLKVGDFDPLHEGNELLVTTGGGTVGGQVREYYKEGGMWKYTVIEQNMGRNIHDCDIGDFDPRFNGNECIVFTSANITEFAWNGSGWYNETIVIPGEIYYGKIGEINSTNNVSEIICAYMSGYIAIMGWNETKYDVQYLRIFEDMSSVRCVAVGDCWSGHTGNEIVVGGGSAARTVLVWEDNGTWQKQLIYENNSEYSVNDIEIGDFDSAHPGNEIALGVAHLFELYEVIPVNESTSPVFVFVPMIGIIPAVIWRLRQEWR